MLPRVERTHYGPKANPWPDTIITSFPHRWGMARDKNGPKASNADLADYIMAQLPGDRHEPFESVMDFAGMVMACATQILIDRTVSVNEKIRYLDFFETEIGKVVSRTDLFRKREVILRRVIHISPGPTWIRIIV